METFRLKSMTDFVLQNSKEPYVEGTKYKDIVSYANFLKKPLKLGYFIPCDENDLPLEEPSFIDDAFNIKLYKYQEAKQRVLFEYKWEFKNWDSSDMENSIIEDLLSDELIYTLTATAKKEIGL